MNQRLQDLQRHQLDATLGKWRIAHLPATPSSGWVRAIRDALGMSAAALARRLGISSPGLRKLELAEADEAITLASLRKLADALNCELHYALVPKKSLEDILLQRARQVARERLSPVAHSMSLEDQATVGSMSKVQLELLANEILAGSRRDLW